MSTSNPGGQESNFQNDPRWSHVVAPILTAIQKTSKCLCFVRLSSVLSRVKRQPFSVIKDHTGYGVKLIVCILLNLFIYLLAFLTQSPNSQYNSQKNIQYRPLVEKAADRPKARISLFSLPPQNRHG